MSLRERVNLVEMNRIIEEVLMERILTQTTKANILNQVIDKKNAENQKEDNSNIQIKKKHILYFTSQ